MDEHLPSQSVLTPEAALKPGETVICSFNADRATYWRENAWLAAIAMACGMGILLGIGNEHVWTGAVGGLFAIAVRAFYLSADETKTRWDLTNRRLLGPGHRAVDLVSIEKVNTIFSAVQLVTTTGDKHLLKYQADTDAVKSAIMAAKRETTP